MIFKAMNDDFDENGRIKRLVKGDSKDGLPEICSLNLVSPRSVSSQTETLISAKTQVK
jgi:hypothetical protein